MENMEIYEKAKSCPENALRTIKGGKLKGKSDINPIWRIKTLTEQFGPCGIGWRLDDIRYWTESGAGGEVSAWCSLKLRIKADGEWSEGIEGVGGSMLVATENGKLVTNDEAYKMAQTDAISVACKLLGFAADVYWEADRTKYDGDPEPTPDPTPEPRICERCLKKISPMKNGGKIYTVEEIADTSKEAYGAELCWGCMKKAKAEQKPEEEAPNAAD